MLNCRPLQFLRYPFLVVSLGSLILWGDEVAVQQECIGASITTVTMDVKGNGTANASKNFRNQGATQDLDDENARGLQLRNDGEAISRS